MKTTKTDQTDFEKRFDEEFMTKTSGTNISGEEYENLFIITSVRPDNLKSFFKQEIAKVLEEIEEQGRNHLECGVECGDQEGCIAGDNALSKITQLRQEYGIERKEKNEE